MQISGLISNYKQKNWYLYGSKVTQTPKKNIFDSAVAGDYSIERCPMKNQGTATHLSQDWTKTGVENQALRSCCIALEMAVSTQKHSAVYFSHFDTSNQTVKNVERCWCRLCRN